MDRTSSYRSARLIVYPSDIDLDRFSWSYTTLITRAGVTRSHALRHGALHLPGGLVSDDSVAEAMRLSLGAVFPPRGR